MNLIGSLMGLANVIDQETKELFGKFCGAAIASGNPNEFVKRALRHALEPEQPAKPRMIDAEVIDVKVRK